MKFNLILPQQEVTNSYQKIVSQAQANMTIPGFRKGKAPIAKVEERLDQSEVKKEILNQLFPSHFTQYIKTNELQPLGQPEINVSKTDLDSDWTIEVEIAQSPEVKLGEYKAEIKKSKKKSKKSVSENKKDPTADRDSQLSLIFDSLLKSITVDVPELLIRQEAREHLAKLLNQIDKLGLTIDDYAASIKKSVSDIQKEYETTAKDRLSLEFILQQIQKEEEIKVNDTEITQFIDNIQDPQTKKAIQANHQYQHDLGHQLERQKTIDFLLSL